MTSFYQQYLLSENRVGDDGFWTGDDGASGILAICRETSRICLARRSEHVQHGECFGILGGAVQGGLTPEESAIAELREETGYRGNVRLIPAYVFRQGSFVYRNFIGLVPREFGFNPAEEHSWETDYIVWKTYDEIINEMESEPEEYHFGIIALFENSRSLIEKYTGR